MIKLLFILSITLGFNVCSQIINTRGCYVSIQDSSLFFDKQLNVIHVSKKKKIDLCNKLYDNIEFDPISINGSQYIVISNERRVYSTKILHDDNNDFILCWSILVNLKSPIEKFTLSPVYCDGKILVMNFIGATKIKKGKVVKRGIIHTFIYEIK